jgi:hypothetical protein
LCRMRVLIVNVRPVSKIVFDAIASDIAPRAAGVTLDVRVIVRCIYECWLVAKGCRTGVRREGSSHRRPHESGSHYDNEHRSHWVISLFEWTHSNSPRNNRLGLLLRTCYTSGRGSLFASRIRRVASLQSQRCNCEAPCDDIVSGAEEVRVVDPL